MYICDCLVLTATWSIYDVTGTDQEAASGDDVIEAYTFSLKYYKVTAQIKKKVGW